LVIWKLNYFWFGKNITGIVGRIEQQKVSDQGIVRIEQASFLPYSEGDIPD